MVGESFDSEALSAFCLPVPEQAANTRISTANSNFVEFFIFLRCMFINTIQLVPHPMDTTHYRTRAPMDHKV